jgi:hypothetical protein
MPVGAWGRSTSAVAKIVKKYGGIAEVLNDVWSIEILREEVGSMLSLINLRLGSAFELQKSERGLDWMARQIDRSFDE